MDSWLNHYLIEPIYCIKDRVALLADVNRLTLVFVPHEMKCPKCGVTVPPEDTRHG